MLRIVRDGDPFKPGEAAQPEQAVQELSLPRLIGACDQVCRLLPGHTGLPIKFHDGYAAGVSEALALAKAIEAVLTEVVNNKGKLVVRYLGDLKSTEYGLDAQFFHLTDSVTEGEMTDFLRRAATSGKPEVDFINLQNVRDIKVKVTANEVVDLHEEIGVLRRASLALAGWVGTNSGFKVIDA